VTAGTKRLWVIDPSVQFPEDQGVRNVVGDFDGEVRVFRPSLIPGDGPTPDAGYATDGVVVMGSATSVLDDLPWLRELSAWLRPIVDGQVAVPLLGICFGHQLMAHMVGSEVGFVTPDHEKRLGVETSIVDGSRLLPGRRELRVVVSHREEVKSPPAGYRTIARRGSIAFDGIEHERHPHWGFQFHPEAGSDFARTSGVGAELLDDRQRADSRLLLDAFRRVVVDPAVVPCDEV